MGERARQWLLVAGAGAAAGALSAAAVISLLSRSKRREGYARSLLESNGGTSGKSGSTTRLGSVGSSVDTLADEVVSEQLTRSIQYFGMESQKKVTESYVVVIGLGGVGSHAASMLLRSGVGRLLLVDFDQVALLAACVHRGLRVLSAMGTGARADPTRIRVADLRESSNDPLSRAVRYRLKKDHRIEGGIPIVFSLEKPKAKLLPFQASKESETHQITRLCQDSGFALSQCWEPSLQFLVKLWPPMWLLSLLN